MLVGFRLVITIVAGSLHNMAKEEVLSMLFYLISHSH